jgi:hypothetical protein
LGGSGRKRRARKGPRKVALVEVPLSSDLLEWVERLVVERPELGFQDAEEVIREALRRFLFARPRPPVEGSSGSSRS